MTTSAPDDSTSYSRASEGLRFTSTVCTVTCGVRSWRPEDITKFPTIGDRCSLFAHATVLGDVRIGNDCTIAAHAVVTQNVPNGATARGIPAVVIPTS